MPFYVISGTFRLIGKTKSGKPRGFEPDGDSMQFKPARVSLLEKLERVDFPYKLSSVGSTQLRFEGIDAVEIHFLAGPKEETHQPEDLAEEARDHLLREAGLDPVTYEPNSTIVAEAPHDGAKGFILSRSLEVHGRPVAFVFAGLDNMPGRDGDIVQLDAALLQKSLNYNMLVSGEAYPLFYDGLFADLRSVLSKAAIQARNNRVGLWNRDVTNSGVDGSSIAGLELNGVVFPKLFRRLTEFLAHGGKIKGFKSWLEEKKEPVLDLSTANRTHFDTFVDVSGNNVKMTKAPESLVFYEATSKKAAWV